MDVPRIHWNRDYFHLVHCGKIFISLKIGLITFAHNSLSHKIFHQLLVWGNISKDWWQKSRWCNNQPMIWNLQWVVYFTLFLFFYMKFGSISFLNYIETAHSFVQSKNYSPVSFLHMPQFALIKNTHHFIPTENELESIWPQHNNQHSKTKTSIVATSFYCTFSSKRKTTGLAH